MEVAVKNNTIEFSGILNEDSSIDKIKEGLQKALSNANNKSIFVDFSNVKRANSCGILAWYKILETLDGKFIYINVPLWLVEQFNISDFLGENTDVKSIEANFYCPQNDSHENLFLEIGKDIPVLQDYSSYSMTLKNKDGMELEMDFEPNEYFYFISSRFEKFKGSTKT
jgi:anti-anti-sigma regulatory factor